jgi:hypothetical protein
VLEPGSPLPGQGADCTLFEVGAGLGGTDSGDLAQAFSYGNPFTYGQEQLWLTDGFWTTVTTLLPDGTPESLSGYLGVSVPAGDYDGKPLTPTLGLPRMVTVAGMATPLDKITSGVGATPEIAFQPPSLGTPDHYRIRVLQLDDEKLADGSTLPRRVILTMDTTATSVTIPPGFLLPEKHYYFQVAALSEPGRDPSRPYRYPARSFTAQTYSGVVTP